MTGSRTLGSLSLIFLLIVACLQFSTVAPLEAVAFPSGATFTPVGEVARYSDWQLTGAFLYKVGSGGIEDTKRLSLNVAVGNFRDKAHVYFRAHPTFLSCLQNVWTELDNAGKKVELRSGFIASEGKSMKEQYSRAGTGARLAFASSETAKSFSAMAVAFLRHCPPLFGPLGRDLGLIIESDAIFAYMTGELTPSEFSITKEGSNPDFTGITDLKKWARERFNEVTEPESVPACGKTVAELPVGGVYPKGASISIVGPPDANITRTSASPTRQDFLRLIQYLSDNLAFSIPAKEAATCPKVGGYLGNSALTRCGPRSMSPRLFLRLNVLQKMARTNLSIGLKVEEGWVAEGGPSLRQEGREVRVKAVGGDASTLGQLSRLAVCAGFDFVKREANTLQLAVVKQLDIATIPVTFPSSELLPVAAPAEAWHQLYKPDSGLSADHPLFDSQLDLKVAENVPLTWFKSKEDDVRYMRLHPALLNCFTEVDRWENRGRPASSPKIGIVVERGFMSNMEEASEFNPVLDDRINTHTLGIGIELRYEKPDKTLTVWRLAQSIASVCPLIFQLHNDASGSGRGIGIGVYNRTVHTSLRWLTKVWFQCEQCTEIVPPGGLEAVRSALTTRIAESLNNRIIDPSDINVACLFDDAPQHQNPFFIHNHSLAVRRVRRATTDPPECQANAPLNQFCQQSLAQRKAEVEKVWTIISYKHLIADKKKVRAALEGCFQACSKCTAGAQWIAKVEHCNNLLHWVPFGTLNDRAEVRTNLYPRNDNSASRRACEAGSHCVDHSALFGLFDDSLRARFRPVNDKPTKEMVYDPVSNPSPLPVLLRRLYALTARGEATVWLRNEADVIAMSTSLKVLFVYNKAVTRVRIFVLERATLTTVVGAIEALLEEWRTSACPKTSRSALTPYIAEVAPDAARGKRNAYDERHLLREQWERWLNNEQRSDRL